MLTIKDAHPHISNHPTRTKKVRCLVEMDASDFAAFLALEEIEENEVGQHTLDHIARAALVEGAA